VAQANFLNRKAAKNGAKRAKNDEEFESPDAGCYAERTLCALCAVLCIFAIKPFVARLRKAGDAP
jgi:hypothetical protein